MLIVFGNAGFQFFPAIKWPSDKPYPQTPLHDRRSVGVAIGCFREFPTFRFAEQNHACRARKKHPFSQKPFLRFQLKMGPARLSFRNYPQRSG